MRIFGIQEAEHFCNAYSSETGSSQRSLLEFRKNRVSGTKTLREGTPTFNEYRACLLRDVERSLFLAFSHYRKCLDLTTTSATPWLFVTMYYGSWYASRALLGMFGCAIFNNYVASVAQSSPGNQKIRLRKIGRNKGQINSTYKGTHRQYWDFFYRGIIYLRPLLPSELQSALTPISNDPIWQITNRNNVNYDTYYSILLSTEFLHTFDKNTFPASLPGILNTEYHVFEGTLMAAYMYAKHFNLNTDALDALGGSDPLKRKIISYIYGDKPPSLITKTKKHELLY